MQLSLELFLAICKKISKNRQFLTKFVNINSHPNNILRGVQILQDAKNHSQYEEIFEALQKKTLFAGQIKRAMDRNDCNNMA